MQQWPGQFWGARMTWSRRERAVMAQLESRLRSLEGPVGTILLHDTTLAAPRGSAAGAPVVDGVDQSGRTLNTRGWTPSAPGVLLENDRFSIGSGAGTRLHCVLGDVDADGAGRATLDIWPRLREAPADGEPLVTTAAKGLFFMTSDLAVQRSDRNLTTISASFRERLPLDAFG